MSDDRIVYDVLPHGDEWMLKRRDREREVIHCSTRDEAVEQGRRLATEHEEAFLVIRNQAGMIEEELKIDGDDPRKIPESR
jgi:hypothetical protein